MKKAILVGALFVLAFLLAITPGAQGRRVLSAGDLEYMGAMRVILETGDSWGRTTHRLDGTALRFFGVGRWHSGGDGIPGVEFDAAPGFTMDWPAAGRPNLIRDWGDIYQGKKIGTPGCSPPPPEVVIYWTEGLQWFNNRLYWTYGDQYNTGGCDDPVIGLTEPNGTAYGPWRTTAGNRFTRGSITTIPQWYADQYLGGRRLALTSGLRSGNNGYSWGPTLHAVTPPTPTTPTSEYLSTVPLVNHLVDNAFLNDPDAPPNPPFLVPCCDTRKARPNDYVSHMLLPLDGLDRNGGWWASTDMIESVVWVDLPTVHGVVFMGSLGAGPLWYGGNPGPEGVIDECHGDQGPHADVYNKRWWFYDPLQFAPVTGGQPHLVPHSQFVDPNTFTANQIAACFGRPGGASFEPSTRMLYVAYQDMDFDEFTVKAVIFAWRVRP